MALRKQFRTQGSSSSLTMHDKKEHISQIFRLGARGYLLKDTSPAELPLN